MKKSILLVLAITLCLGLLLGGCSQGGAEVDTQSVATVDTQDTATDDAQSNFCQVLCLTDDGVILWVQSIGNVYVKHRDTALEIAPLQTVVMEFSKGDLESASGTFTDPFDEEQSYMYILEKPKNIRHTTPEEPTFG